MAISNFSYSPTAQYLFKRAYTVSIGQPRPVGPLLPNQGATLQYGNVGTSPAPLKVKFDIDKNMYGASPNHSKIEIFNLSQRTRQAIKKGYVIQLQAGYNGHPGTIFVGNVVKPYSKRDGPDIITTLECGDGESAIVFTTLDKSYPNGTTNVQILQDCATQMGVTTDVQPLVVGSGIVLGIPLKTYPLGFVARGAVKDTLDKICKNAGLEWNVQNGNLNIVPVTAHNGATAIVVSSSTGLIGVPSQGEGFTQFDSLLNPKLAPGALIQLISENTTLNGFYKLRRCHYEGDTHDNKWQVACEAVLFPNVVQALKTAQGTSFGSAAIS